MSMAVPITKQGGGLQARPCPFTNLASDSKSESPAAIWVSAHARQRESAVKSVRPSERLWRGMAR